MHHFKNACFDVLSVLKNGRFLGLDSNLSQLTTGDHGEPRR